MTLLLEEAARVVKPVGRAIALLTSNNAEIATVERMAGIFICY